MMIFVAIPISSKTDNLKKDEILIDNNDFENGSIKKISKLMTRKIFVVSKKVVVKKYGTLKTSSFEKYHNNFCKYFECENSEISKNNLKDKNAK